MKASKVSVLRERGLRRGCGAEPQGCELQFKQHEWKTDTMKTYLLKNPATVERKPERKPCSGPPAPTPPSTSLTHVYSRDSQPRCSPARHDAPTAATAPAATILGSVPAVAQGPVLFIGMDVHNDSIAVSLAPSPEPPSSE